MSKKINNTPLTSQQQRWCENNLHIAKKCSKTFYKKFRDYCEYEDIVSCSYVGLVKAARTFAEGKGEPNNHIFGWIRAEVFRFVKQNEYVRIPDYLHPLRGKTRDFIFNYEGKYNKFPDRDDVIEYLVTQHKTSREIAFKMFDIFATNEYVYMDALNPYYPENGIPDTSDIPETTLMKKESIEKLIKNPYINKRELGLIKKRLQGNSLEDIGNDMGVCRERVRQIQNSVISIIESRNE